MDQYSGQAESDFQATDTQKEFRYKSGISGKLRFERLNEVTWKLTNLEMTVPRYPSKAATDREDYGMISRW